jgi:hypothetical protein
MPVGVYPHKKGVPPWNKGKTMPNKSGGNSSNWKGGVSMNFIVKHVPRPKAEKCEVCGCRDRICLDHSHKTHKFRGWICFRCNTALGMVQDDPIKLWWLIVYLNKDIGLNPNYLLQYDRNKKQH